MKNGNLPKVAYFCMEFGLNENFNIYSGGSEYLPEIF